MTNGVSIAFDAKSTTNKTNFPLQNIKKSPSNIFTETPTTKKVLALC
ncbi:Holliday junction resolvase RecU [Bacillus paranthracis]